MSTYELEEQRIADLDLVRDELEGFIERIDERISQIYRDRRERFVGPPEPTSLCLQMLNDFLEQKTFEALLRQNPLMGLIP